MDENWVHSRVDGDEEGEGNGDGEELSVFSGLL